MNPKAEFMLITPDLASKWLKKNKKNRNLSQLIVDRYVTSILRDRWVVTGQSIEFDVDGNLMDGQHRLHAVIKADTPAHMLVATGLPPEARNVIDTGRRRTPADVLMMEGCRNCTYVAGSARLLYHYDTGTMHQYTDPIRRPGNETILSMWQEHPMLEESTIWGRRTTVLRMAPSVATFCHYIFSRIDADDAHRFFDALVEGAGLTKDSPILLLRNRLLENSISKARLGSIDIAALTIKAWNHWRKQAPLRSLRWRTAKKSNGAEAFPRAK